jgi:SagB-type dehydrogenase family enzyme
MTNSTYGKDYHNRTSYDRRRMTGHPLDWDHRPDLYKRYPNTESIPLPQNGGSMGSVSLWDIVQSSHETLAAKKMDLEGLAGLLGLSYGITASVRYPQETFSYRSAPSAGALYPCEIYIAAYDIEGLDPGLYYFSVIDFALKQIRAAEIAGFLEQNSEKGLALSLYITGIPYRSAWKYRARAYRYVLLDCGHLLGNLALVLKSQKLIFELTYDLDDAATGLLLGLDNRREAGVARIDAGCPDAWQKDAFVSPEEIPVLAGEILSASRVSARETGYPEIEQMLAAQVPGQPPSPADLPDPPTVVRAPEKWQPAGQANWPAGGDPLGRIMVRRRSSRNFLPLEIPADSFNNLLALLSAALSGSLAMGPPPGRYVSLGFVAGAIEGVAPGFYLLDPQVRQYTLVSPGQLAPPMAAACLNQDWLKNAGVHFLFMLNPGHLDETCGPRGYRYAMIQAGFLGQLVYLGATALGLGSCGIGAIYDNEAQTVLGLSSGSVLGYLVAAGIVKKMK